MRPCELENLKNMGYMTALAIGIHNFPEGLATFIAALADSRLGLALAVAIAVHNVPEAGSRRYGSPRQSMLFISRC